jgi:hypothetical protein
MIRLPKGYRYSIKGEFFERGMTYYDLVDGQWKQRQIGNVDPFPIPDDGVLRAVPKLPRRHVAQEKVLVTFNIDTKDRPRIVICASMTPGEVILCLRDAANSNGLVVNGANGEYYYIATDSILTISVNTYVEEKDI